MRRGFAVSLCALSVTFCVASGAASEQRPVRGRALAQPACPSAPPGARVATGPGAGPEAGPGGGPDRDRPGLGAGQATAMLDDLRGVLRLRFGSDDEQRLEDARRVARHITVPVRLHVVTAGAVGRLSRAALDRQIATLNDAYGGRRGGADTGVRFKLVATDVTDNAAWFRAPQRYERPMKAALGRGGAGTLNLYTAAGEDDVLGFSTFPQAYARDPGIDGVVVDHRTLPGGPLRHFGRGYTAVHEIGHWLGLLHTFENGCEEPGDGIADTPYEARPAAACPAGRDSCEQPGYDPVHNFMDYGWDECMREFTGGQGRRIRAAWAAYRAPGRKSLRLPLTATGARSVGGDR
ncbi:zinc metalloprotease [Actinomadura macrotermitis]|uniref:Peptidase M43 pregnancy-associated plasma-A domain-containing protein n=1 Tax=Actinomadura macrotermitis TaxID=2585200 RepID=A0A7K0C1U1_9ACTN|nr:zinc metalloprotease [Actinomadura macrotermitis]MQY06754.1 hypothetical protein [Actinomadura macrotermitis]